MFIILIGIVALVLLIGGIAAIVKVDEVENQSREDAKKKEEEGTK